MANLFDYLSWRGDLSFAQAPLNEVDNLVLCKLCCPDLRGCVPAPEEGAPVTLAQASRRYFAARGNAPDKLGVLISDAILPMIRQAAQTERFGGVLLSDYINRIDDLREEQFSALTMRLGDGSLFVAFRGTDDTLAGWKENFNMSFLSAVPAQMDAVEYVTRIAGAGAEPLRVGGHSKGGNLAVYAAAYCPPALQSRILHVYNNDGPGFRSSMLELQQYGRVRDRITTLVPQSSIVGMLLEHEEDYEVIRSLESGPLQHDGLTWEVCGPSFVHLESTTGGSRYLDRALKTWVDSVDDASRRAFTDALFGILEATGARTLTELSERRLQKAAAMLQAYRDLDESQRRMMLQTLRQLARAAGGALPHPHARRGE